MFLKVKEILIIVLSAGGITAAVYDMVTGKLTDNPKMRRRINFCLYLILIIIAVKLIIKNFRLVISQV